VSLPELLASIIPVTVLDEHNMTIRTHFVKQYDGSLLIAPKVFYFAYLGTHPIHLSPILNEIGILLLIQIIRLLE